MKSLIVALAFFMSLFIGAYLFSEDILMAEIYVCDEEQLSAELNAKVGVSRKELYIVSYCTCQGMDKSLSKLVKHGKCVPPKDSVYKCTCVGKSNY